MSSVLDKASISPKPFSRDSGWETSISRTLVSTLNFAATMRQLNSNNDKVRGLTNVVRDFLSGSLSSANKDNVEAFRCELSGEFGTDTGGSTRDHRPSLAFSVFERFDLISATMRWEQRGKFGSHLYLAEQSSRAADEGMRTRDGPGRERRPRRERGCEGEGPALPSACWLQIRDPLSW